MLTTINKTFKYFKTFTNFVLRSLWKKNGKAWGLPIHIQVETTNNCNLKCQSCHRDLLHPRPKDLGFDGFKKVFDEVKPLRVNVSGIGEPFLNKKIFNIIEYAKSASIPVNCATNFTLVEDKVEEILDSGIDQLKVSIDAATQGSYLKIRAYDKFDTLVNNIKLLNKRKKERGTDKPSIRFNYALQAENIDELFETIELAKSLDVKTMYIQYLEYTDREDRKKNLVGNITKEKLKEKLLKADELTKSYGIVTNIDIWWKNFDYYWNKMLPSDQFIPNNKPCYFPWFSSWIDADGSVRPCPIIPWQNGVAVMGNVLEEPFEKIWNNEKYQEFRKALARGERPTDPCKTCIPSSLGTIFQIGTKLLPQKK